MKESGPPRLSRWVSPKPMHAHSSSVSSTGAYALGHSDVSSGAESGDDSGQGWCVPGDRGGGGARLGKHGIRSEDGSNSQEACLPLPLPWGPTASCFMNSMPHQSTASGT